MKGKKIIPKRAYSLKYYFFLNSRMIEIESCLYSFSQVLQQKILLGNTK